MSFFKLIATLSFFLLFLGLSAQEESRDVTVTELLNPVSENKEEAIQKAITEAVDQVAKEIIFSDSTIPETYKEPIRRTISFDAKSFVIQYEVLSTSPLLEFLQFKSITVKTSISVSKIKQAIPQYTKHLDRRLELVYQIHLAPAAEKILPPPNLTVEIQNMIKYLKDEEWLEDAEVEIRENQCTFSFLMLVSPKRIEDFKSMMKPCTFEFRLVASAQSGGMIPDEERMHYQKAKEQGKEALASYEKRLFEKGFAWLPAKDTIFPDYLIWYKDGYDITNYNFARFYTTADEYGSKTIGFEIKDEYKAKFYEMTVKYKGESLAILFNSKVISAPKIQSPIPGTGVLTGFQPDEANQLINGLNIKFPLLQIELISERIIGTQKNQ